MKGTGGGSSELKGAGDNGVGNWVKRVQGEPRSGNLEETSSEDRVGEFRRKVDEGWNRTREKRGQGTGDEKRAWG